MFEMVAVGAIAITFEFLIPSFLTFFLSVSQSNVSDLSTFKYSLPLFSSRIFNESFGSIKHFREAFDAGEYIRVGELSPYSSKKDLNKKYTLKNAIKAAKSSN